MRVHLGIDVGSVSLKAAVVPADTSAREQFTALQEGTSDLLQILTDANGDPSDRTILGVLSPRRTKGRPKEAVAGILSELREQIGPVEIASITVTGSGGETVAGLLNAGRCNEFQAIARAMDRLYSNVRTVFEIGGETSKYLRLEPDPSTGELGILDYSTNGDCAAGTGAFLDQQAGRLKYSIEEIGAIVAEAERAAQIAGRCSVFAKSDMIHAQQKGYEPPEVLRGLCKAVATNYRSAVVKGKAPEAPVALIGGVAANAAVVNELRDVFELEGDALFVPEGAASMVAVGAAIIGSISHAAAAKSDALLTAREQLDILTGESQGSFAFSTSTPLSLEKVQLLRDHAKPYEFPTDGSRVDAALGIDIGSVGTKLVVIDQQGDVIHHIFTRTEGRPIEVVSRILRELEETVGDRIRIIAAGTTGSGRELIGELIGADAITDEITCHKTGASFIGRRLLGKQPDTIFEIGGQDSKYISLEPESGGSNGDGEAVVVDFTMNEACAAGTGSFLEERAEELGISIKGEFAELALGSKDPIRLGERCTVFMERDVNTAMQRGAKRDDVVAGLSYSIAYNYINRVVRGRKIGECIFFQGGTAYNDAVAAAFSAVTGKEIIVPPYNAVMGCIGAAMVARDKINATGTETRFRGYDVGAVDYTLREFTCKGCGNYCSVQEFNVEGEKTFWGDKCSDRYRKRTKVQHKPVIPDLVSLRRELLHADDKGDPEYAEKTIGIPMAMYTWDLLPLWRRFFRDCGFKVAVSSETNKRTVRMGSDCVVAEPCFPIIVAHGHLAELAEKNVDHIWLPNIMSAETKFEDQQSHVCPWGQTLPFVARQAPSLRAWQGRILCPTIHFRDGRESVRKSLVQAATELGVSKSTANRAFDAGMLALNKFRNAYQEAGREALEILDRTGETGMVIVGRPYNIHDPGVSISTAKKLREFYGVNVLPIDALPVTEIDTRDINENMFWEYGRRILAASKLVAERPHLHMIYITNFKCGPDSFVKAFVRPASGDKPFLTLQFDGHSNDAGMMTRCEAYLDSKGVLRWWKTCKNEPAVSLSEDERSTSPKWPTPVPG